MDRLPKIEEFVEEKVENIKEDIMDIDMDEVAEEVSTSANDDLIDDEPEEPVAVRPREKVSQDIFGVSKSANELEVKKIKKPKRQISEAQKERLRLGRQKGLETRRRNAELKKQEKENKKKSIKEKKKVEFSSDETEISIPPELQDEFKKLATEPITEKIIAKKINNGETTLTRKDIEEISAQTSQKVLEDYEILRKQRKKEKKERLEQENHRKKVRETIQSAVKGPQRDTTFDFCFA